MIHTTHDGEAYLLRKKSVGSPEIFVIDQSWPLNVGPLPPDRALNKKLNEKSKLSDELRICELLHNDNQLRPSKEIYKQMQFFNKFKHLAYTNEHQLKVFSLEYYAQKPNTYYSRTYSGYKCLIVLSIDKKGDFCYLLGKNEDYESNKAPDTKSRKQQWQQRSASAATAVYQSELKFNMNSSKYRTNTEDGLYAIIKYNFQTEKDIAYQIEGDLGNVKLACNYLQQAE